jgi:hypothetical protein
MTLSPIIEVYCFDIAIVYAVMRSRIVFKSNQIILIQTTWSISNTAYTKKPGYYKNSKKESYLNSNVVKNQKS